MDEAARRVNPSALARLAALRRRREEEAARVLRGLADARDHADAKRMRAAEAVAAREAERRSGERAIYAALTVGGPMDLGRLEDRQQAITRLGEAVAQAQTEEVEQAAAADAARAMHAEGRSTHARRARDTQKWDRACERIHDARRAFAEASDEAESEDETSLRFAARAGVCPP